MLDTELLGDPAACRETGQWMARVSTGTFDTATVLNEVRGRTHDCWRGEAATAFEDHLSRGGREADQLAEEIGRAGRALIAFSEELDTARSRLQQARAVAAAGGLTLTPQGIEPPPAVTLPAVPTTPQQLAAIDTYQAQVRAWDEAYQTVSLARGIELAAHERLAAATTAPTSMIETPRSNVGFIATGVALGAAGTLHSENSRFRQLSRQQARDSLRITQYIADRPNLPKGQRSLLQAIRNEIGDRAVTEHRIARSQARLLGGLDRTTGGRYTLDAIVRAPATKIPGSGLFARGGRVLGRVPYAGLLVTGTQVAWDIRHGKPADRALVPAVVSTGVGAGVSSGVLAGATALSVAGGPVTLVAVGVGTVAAVGVGYVLDHHWDAIKDTTGAAADGVGEGMDRAARKVGEWLG